jgi:putative membrane protein
MGLAVAVPLHHIGDLEPRGRTRTLHPSIPEHFGTPSFPWRGGALTANSGPGLDDRPEVAPPDRLLSGLVLLIEIEQEVVGVMDGGMGMWGMGLGMLIWTALLIALITVAVVLVVKAVRRPEPGRRDGTRGREDWSAEDEVRMRYARGELDGEEFRRRLQDLRDS